MPANQTIPEDDSNFIPTLINSRTLPSGATPLPGTYLDGAAVGGIVFCIFVVLAFSGLLIYKARQQRIMLQRMAAARKRAKKAGKFRGRCRISYGTSSVGDRCYRQTVGSQSRISGESRVSGESLEDLDLEKGHGSDVESRPRGYSR